MAEKSLDVLIRIITEHVGDKKASEILDQYKKSAGEAGESTKLFAGEQKHLNHLFREINKLAPGAGVALKELFHPSILSGALMAGFAAEKLHEALKKDAEIDPAAFKGIAEAIEAQKTAFEGARLAAEKYIRETIRAALSADTIGDFAKRMETVNKDFGTAQEKINRAAKDSAEAIIDEQERNHVLTHKQALEEKYQLDVEYMQRQIGLQKQLADQEVAILRRELAGYQGQSVDIAGKTGAAATAAGAYEKHKASLDTLKENLEASREKVKEAGGQSRELELQELNELYDKLIPKGKAASAAKKVDELVNYLTTFPNLPSPRDSYLIRLFESHAAELETVSSEPEVQKKLQQAIKAEQEKEFALKNEANKTEEELAEARKDQLDKNKKITELTRQIAVKTADTAAAITNAQTEAYYNTQTARAKAGLPTSQNPFARPATAAGAGAGVPPPFSPHAGASEPGSNETFGTDATARRDIGKLQDYANFINHGGSLDDKQSAAFMSIVRTVLGKKAESQQAVHELLQEVLTNQNTIDAAYTAVRNELIRLRSQLKTRL